MIPFELFKVNDVYMQVYYQLPCASLTPHMWIPFEKSIQSHIWNNYNYVDDIRWTDIETQILYHLCWAIFHHNGFSESIRFFIHENIHFINEVELLSLFKPVFYGFSDRMMELLKREGYDEMIQEYHSFIDY